MRCAGSRGAQIVRRAIVQSTIDGGTYLWVTSPCASISKMLLGVPDHAGPSQLPSLHGWSLGSRWRRLKTMKVLWLFILSLLWVSHARTKERDTSSHSRALSWFLRRSLDTQPDMPMDRHAGVNIRGFTTMCVSPLFPPRTSLSQRVYVAQRHTFGLPRRRSAPIMQHSCSPGCSVRTSAHSQAA